MPFFSFSVALFEEKGEGAWVCKYLMGFFCMFLKIVKKKWKNLKALCGKGIRFLFFLFVLMFCVFF